MIPPVFDIDDYKDVFILFPVAMVCSKTLNNKKSTITVMAQKKYDSEKQKAKAMMPKYHAEAQKLAKERVKELLKAIRDEPLPDDKAVTQEHTRMLDVEQRLARMLKPLDKVLNSKRLAPTKNKSRSKKTKKASKSVSKKKSAKKTKSSRSKKR